MGVRFECPAGHKLHVKAELAGKRGICPECGAKFVVPSFSGQRVPGDDGVTTSTVAAATPPSLPARGATQTPSLPPGVPTPAPVVPGAPIPTAPPARRAAGGTAPQPEPTVWYIRPAAGGQFGPASDEVFRQWVAEGRVAADSWVWRTGWPDWKAGAEALAIGMSPAPNFAGAAPAADDPFDFDDDDVAAPFGADFPAAALPMPEATSTHVRASEIERRKKQVRNFSLLLSVVAFAMFVVLIFVLNREPEEAAPAEGGETPAVQETAPAPEAPEAEDAAPAPAAAADSGVAE